MSFEFEGSQILAEDGETVLSALLRNGKDIANRCRAGACQACLLRSDDPLPASSQLGLAEELVGRGALLACQTPSQSIRQVERLGPEAIPRVEARLISKNQVTEDVLVVDFSVPGWQACPGRFLRLVHPTGVVRNYSVATPAWDEPTIVRLHVRLIQGGEMSGLLRKAELGSPFAVEGPLGKCTYRSEDGSEPILLIGSGTGLAPLYAITSSAINQGHTGPITWYHGSATSSQHYYRQEVDDLTKGRDRVSCTRFADRDVSLGDRSGSPLDSALQDNPDLTGFRVYLCGHPMLVRAAKRRCFLAGAGLKNIHADAFEPS